MIPDLEWSLFLGWERLGLMDVRLLYGREIVEDSLGVQKVGEEEV